ncbi:MAG: hypothetical protein O2783_08160, partial [Chloroflexi bacterium]|nr:hypothetical protein [Chloroflexota bacterium]
NDSPVPWVNTKAGAPSRVSAPPGMGAESRPLFTVCVVRGEASSMPEAMGIAQDIVDNNIIEIRSECGELVARCRYGKWWSSQFGKEPTYDGRNA